MKVSVEKIKAIELLMSHTGVWPHDDDDFAVVDNERRAVYSGKLSELVTRAEWDEYQEQNRPIQAGDFVHTTYHSGFGLCKVVWSGKSLAVVEGIDGNERVCTLHLLARVTEL